MLNDILLWSILIAISIIIEWRIFKFVLDEFSDCKKNKITRNVSLIIIIILITILTIRKVDPNIKLIICIIVGYIFYIYNYKYTILKGIIISVSYLVILMVLDYISLNIILITNNMENVYYLLKNNIFRLETIVLSKILLVSLVPIVKGLKFQIKFKIKEFVYIIIPVIANILSVVVTFTLAMDSIKERYIEHLMIFIISIILLISSVSLISIILSIIKNYNIRIENKIIQEKIDIQYKHYLNLQEAQMKVRKLYHDMNNHIVCIQKMCVCSDVSEVYIENIKDELNDWSSIFSTENMILDIILNEKKDVCNNNIKLLADINFSKCSFIEMLDVCSIFSNMLDNAIEACIKIEDMKLDKYIKLKGTIVNDFFVIKCENSKANKIKLKNKKIKTDKKDTFSHGMGIRSIKKSVEKYNGEVAINFSENEFIMKIYIPLR